MIPKIIHYCWFGNTEIPAESKAYIAEWKELNPEWKIRRWDENNAFMNIPYVQNALKQQNWANISNYIRLKILEEFGGIYLDVDVKLIKKLDSLLKYACFLGFESGAIESNDFSVNNAIIGSEKQNPFIIKALEFFSSDFDGSERANLSSPVLMTNILRQEYGLTFYGRQQLNGVMIFEKEVFYPLPFEKVFDVANLNSYLTPNTIAVHLWGRSWYPTNELLERIDNQSLFIHNYLEYIKVLESKLSETKNQDISHSEKYSSNSIFKKNIELMEENHINSLNMRLASLQEAIHTVNKKSSSIEKTINDKLEDKGVFFILEHLSSRLKDIESKMINLQVNSSLLEKDLSKDLKDVNGKILKIQNTFTKHENEFTAQKKEISVLTKTIDSSQNEFVKAIHNLEDSVGKIVLKMEAESNSKELLNRNGNDIENNTVDNLSEEINALKKIILNRQLEREDLLQQVTFLQSELNKKNEENEKQNFRVSSLSTYIENFSLIRKDFENRIFELEGLVQKMRLKNRVKRIFGAYKK